MFYLFSRYAKFLVQQAVTLLLFFLIPVLTLTSGGLTYYYKPILNTSDPIEVC